VKEFWMNCPASTPTSPALISIALCTFNGENYLREQLDSLLNQDWPHLEIFAIDDASSDSSPLILAEYASRHACIKYQVNAQNLGYLKNFESVINQCRGHWIAPCDQDDIWLPNKLSLLAKELEKSDSLLAFCDSELISEDGRSMNRRVSNLIHLFSTDDPAALLEQNMVSGHAMLFCRSLIPAIMPFPAGLFHDWWIAYVALSSAPIKYVNLPLVKYRQHAKSVTDISGKKEVTKKIKRHRGFRSQELAFCGERYKLLATVPGKGQAFTSELAALWQARESQILSWRLALFLWKNCLRIHAVSFDSIITKKRRTWSFFWGLKAKRIVKPHRYQVEQLSLCKKERLTTKL
jgi:glycosyltransferase involved in cell wall biosynthesis